MARRSNSLTKFLQDVVDNSKDLVDDLIDRGRDVESDVRTGVSKAVSNEDDDHTDADLARLQVSLAELSAKVDALAKAKPATTAAR
ncbi:hypothetical protein I4I73_03155 [Pseudonocardia sp. KRD-184]|uniref:Uncharacterized protein n=1 Tax=Pseudonocardia oceani TaxID=2792013 RepID=A0ABS6U2U8_9PSEU|nr:hypothetical protein [Pseudonocardia oceani]MBW0090464.1 hypothetical protein [Pseudonocardia oceani]MBW0094994.1 hypothetical protein [Pseudonocardia oceani]MBW0107826.1 hypothetical protein [Pseudonocardia oceani]MBW0121451.1 hypothetical protein [Pseudonocardia oceani]MBW0126439.1 hypothetical protein [Pseudonocardia oceani]